MQIVGQLLNCFFASLRHRKLIADKGTNIPVKLDQVNIDALECIVARLINQALYFVKTIIYCCHGDYSTLYRFKATLVVLFLLHVVGVEGLHGVGFELVVAVEGEEKPLRRVFRNRRESGAD